MSYVDNILKYYLFKHYKYFKTITHCDLYLKIQVKLYFNKTKLTVMIITSKLFNILVLELFYKYYLISLYYILFLNFSLYNHFFHNKYFFIFIFYTFYILLNLCHLIQKYMKKIRILQCLWIF